LVKNYSSANLANISSRGFVDFSNGIAGYYNHYRAHSSKVQLTSNFGISFNHITQPEQSLIFKSSKLPIKYTAYYSVVFPFGKKKFMTQYRNKLLYLAGIYETQSVFHQFTIGGNVKFFPFYAGLWLRERNVAFSNIDAMIFTSGIETKINNNYNLRIGYAYDFTISHLVASSPGSHELSLSISSIINNRGGNLSDSGWNLFKSIFGGKNRATGSERKKRINCYYFF
jgi:hypothetical protein